MNAIELSKYLNITSRRVEQLTKSSVLSRSKDGYDLQSCTVAYIAYLKKWRSASKVPFTYVDLAAAGANPAWVRRQVRMGIIKKIEHGKYDVSGIVRAFIETTKRKEV